MQSILTVQSLSKSFRFDGGDIPALRNVSFSVLEPQIVALAGPSGSGKSTLLNCLARFEPADGGSVRIGTIDIAGISEAELDRFRNETLGFIFQQFNLISVLTALENVQLALVPRRLSREQSRREAALMLKAVGLDQRMHHRPPQLSGGQQQRVAIARALVGRPAIVIADEPTGSLDGTTAAGIVHLMRELKVQFETTFLIATHDPRVMDLADRIIELKDGEISHDRLAEHGLAQCLA